MIIPVVLVEFTGVSVIGPFPLADTFERLPTIEDVHVKVVPAIDDVGRKLNDVPLHISCIKEVEEFVITGLGLTVTTTSTKFPEHPLAAGVIR
jgi:hypothetical protein